MVSKCGHISYSFIFLYEKCFVWWLIETSYDCVKVSVIKSSTYSYVNQVKKVNLNNIIMFVKCYLYWYLQAKVNWVHVSARRMKYVSVRKLYMTLNCVFVPTKLNLLKIYINQLQVDINHVEVIHLHYLFVSICKNK